MKIPFLSELHVLTPFRSLSVAALLIFAGWVNIQGQEPATTPKDNGEQPKSSGEVAKGSAQDQSKIKVVFDDNSPSVVFIESNGERIRVDTAKKTVEQIAS